MQSSVDSSTYPATNLIVKTSIEISHYSLIQIHDQCGRPTNESELCLNLLTVCFVGLNNS